MWSGYKRTHYITIFCADPFRRRPGTLPTSRHAERCATILGNSAPFSPPRDLRERKLSQAFSNYLCLSEIDEELDISLSDAAHENKYDSDDYEYRDPAPDSEKFPIHDSVHLKNIDPLKPITLDGTRRHSSAFTVSPVLECIPFRSPATTVYNLIYLCFLAWTKFNFNATTSPRLSRG